MTRTEVWELISERVTSHPLPSKKGRVLLNGSPPSSLLLSCSLIALTWRGSRERRDSGCPSPGLEEDTNGSFVRQKLSALSSSEEEEQSRFATDLAVDAVYGKLYEVLGGRKRLMSMGNTVRELALRISSSNESEEYHNERMVCRIIRYQVQNVANVAY